MEKKVTRSKVMGIAKYNVNGKEGMLVSDSLTEKLAREFYGEGLKEFGYAPVTYSMTEEVFMEHAEGKVPEDVKLYPDRTSCPKFVKK